MKLTFSWSKAIVATALFAAAATFSRAQSAPEIRTPGADKPADFLELPFTLIANHIVLEVKIGKDSASAAKAPTLHFILDTGASTTILSAEAKAANRLTFGTSVYSNFSVPVKGIGDSKGVNATQFFNEMIEIGRYEGVGTVLIVPMGPDVRRYNVDGAIGDDFFGAAVVEIDYAKKIIRLFRPDAFRPPAPNEDFTAVPLLFKRDGIPYVLSSVTPFGYGATKTRMALDTGDAGSVTLYGSFVDGQKWKAALPQVIPQLSSGIGGRGTAFIARLRESEFGGVTIQQPPVSFSTARQGAFAMSDVDGQFGGNVFKRFTLIFDYGHKVVYVRPNDTAAKPFPPDRYYGWHGLPPITATGGYLIEVVDASSPASRAGIHAKDSLFKIDGQSVSSLTFDALAEKLSASGDERTFEIRTAGGARRLVKIKPITY